MSDRRQGCNALIERASNVECVILDAGSLPIDLPRFAGVIRSILGGQITELARDHNSICYRASLAKLGELPDVMIVKMPRMGEQRTNADTTFAWEAKILAELSVAGFMGAPELLARIAAAGKHFLFTTEVPGKHPDPVNNPLNSRQLRAILERVFEMDRHGFMHYDLKAANILVADDGAGFIDFEFSRFEDYRSTYASEKAAVYQDFNVSTNPFFPALSNIVNFEFRALHRYLNDLAASHSPAAADTLFSEWLCEKSAFHQRMKDHIAELAETACELIAIAGRIEMDEAREKLHAAAMYEDFLADLYDEPHEAVIRIERALMAFRCAIFERRNIEAQSLRDAILIEIRPDSAHADAIPDPYRHAIARTLELVGRSVHPPPETCRLRESQTFNKSGAVLPEAYYLAG